jgi:hypothetical protein
LGVSVLLFKSRQKRRKFFTSYFRVSLNEAALSYISNRSESGAIPSAHLSKSFKEALTVQRILCSAPVGPSSASLQNGSSDVGGCAAAADAQYDDFPADALRSFISHRSDDNRKKKTETANVSKQSSRACKTTPL